jgi:hypothetical protein
MNLIPAQSIAATVHFATHYLIDAEFSPGLKGDVLLTEVE